MKNYKCIRKGKIIYFDELKSPLKVKKELSIVIPTYNEEDNIEGIIMAIKEVINKTEFEKRYQIIIVDDNSRDNTPKIIDRLAKEIDVIALHRYEKRGIFSAVFDGMKIANSDYILTMDADFSHPPEVIPKLLENKDGYDIISGSRFVKEGRTDAPFLRKWGSFFLNRLCASILGVRTYDLGGNFRLFNKKSLSKIVFKYDSRFAEFGLEIFYRAKKLGLKTKEVPFVYKFRTKGKSKMGNIPMGLALLYLKRAFELRLGG